MKQHVTPKQLKEVEKERLINCYGSELVNRKDDFYNYHHKKFTIGKMIEILNDHESIEIKHCPLIASTWEVSNSYNRYINEELCDSLWEAMKDII